MTRRLSGYTNGPVNTVPLRVRRNIPDGVLTANVAGDAFNSDQIANTSDVTLSGTGSPTFNLNGNTETIDALNSTNTSA